MHLRLGVHDEVATNSHVHRRSPKWTDKFQSRFKNNIFYRISGHLGLKRLDFFLVSCSFHTVNTPLCMMIMC